MSACTFIASDIPLPTWAPPKDHPLDINIDTGAIYDGDADDNFFLHAFEDVQSYSSKKYGVWLEWRYTHGRGKQIVKYIRDALRHTDSIELWHVWLTAYCEYEDSPVVHSRTIPVNELTENHIKELDSAEIWNIPDKMYPNRPSFYRLTIKA